MTASPDNCATVLTPPAVGAIAVVAVCGSRAVAVLAELTGRAEPFVLRRTYLVKLADAGEVLDEGLLIRRDDDAFELHVHGGTAVVEALLGALARREIIRVQPQEAPPRLRGFGAAAEESTIAAEALTELPAAGSASSVRLLLAQRRGGLTAWARENVQRLQAHGSGSGDRDALWRTATEAQWLLDRWGVLRHLITPPRVAIIGPPNAGKSTLANLMVGRPSSITSDQPGTTRDWIDAAAQIGYEDVVLRTVLVDTAGVRQTDDPIELQSINRTHEQVGAADMIIFVVEGSAVQERSIQAWLENLADRQSLRYCPLILALNKADQGMPGSGMACRGVFAAVSMSARTRQGMDTLQTQMIAGLGLTNFEAAEAVAFTGRQRHILQRLTQSASPQDAVRDLDELLGGPV